MKPLKVTTVLGVALLMFTAQVHAAKVCLQHQGKYILVDEASKQQHLDQGDQEANAESCIEACVSHKGKNLAVAKDALQEHINHGDQQLAPADCL